MDINATLIGTTVAFLVFVLFCYKFIWPPLINAIETRQQEIANALNSASKAREEIAQEKNLADIEIEKAKVKAKEIIKNAESQATKILDRAHAHAVEQEQQLLNNAKKEIELEKVRTQQELRMEVSEIAIAIAEKIIQRELSAADNQDIINNALSKL